MAKGFKTGGRNFTSESAKKAGASTGKGKGAPIDLVAARKQFAHDFETAIYNFMHTPVDDLKAILDHPKTNAKTAVVLSVLINAIEKGDQQRLSFLLERTIGKVKDVSEVEITGLHKTLVDLLSEE